MNRPAYLSMHAYDACTHARHRRSRPKMITPHALFPGGGGGGAEVDRWRLGLCRFSVHIQSPQRAMLQITTCFSVCLIVCLCVSACPTDLSGCLSGCLLAWLTAGLPIDSLSCLLSFLHVLCLSACLFDCLPAWSVRWTVYLHLLSVVARPFVYLPYLSVYLSAYQSACLPGLFPSRRGIPASSSDRS